MRRARKVDANQAEIVAALRKAGCSVEVLSDVGRGVPDLLVGYQRGTFLCEVKMIGEGFTTDQLDWSCNWRGSKIAVLQDINDVEMFVRGLRSVIA